MVECREKLLAFIKEAKRERGLNIAEGLSVTDILRKLKLIKDGKLTNVESFTDTHVRVDASDLPASRRIISYENGEVTVKSLTFSNHKML